MKILFDQGTPVPLRKLLTGHSVGTAYEQGWDKIGNGDLLSAAESAGFQIFITTDKNLRYQQTMAGRKIAVIVLPTTRWPEIQQHGGKISQTVEEIHPGGFIELLW